MMMMMMMVRLIMMVTVALTSAVITITTHTRYYVEGCIATMISTRLVFPESRCVGSGPALCASAWWRAPSLMTGQTTATLHLYSFKFVIACVNLFR